MLIVLYLVLPGDLKHVNPGDQISVLRSLVVSLQEGEDNIFCSFDYLDILFSQPLTEADFCFAGFSDAANAHQSPPHMK